MSYVKRGWIKNNNSELQLVYQQCCDKAKELGLIDYTPELYLFKSTRTWGWACRPNKFVKPYVGLNMVYLQDVNKAINTICHELAHVSNTLSGGSGHDYAWKLKFEKLGRQFELSRFERCSSADEIGLQMPKNYKYEAYCPKCGRSWKRQKMVRLIQHPEFYRCTNCHSELKSRKI